MAIQHRRGTAAAATSANVVLAAGQLGTETDTGQTKVGDGSTAWNSLPYSGSNGHPGVLLRASGDVYLTANTPFGVKTMYVLAQELTYAIVIGRGGVSVIGLQVRVTGPIASSTIRLGVRADSDGTPGTLIVDGGTVDASTAGIKTTTIAWTPASRTRYWVSATAQGGASGPGVNALDVSNGLSLLPWKGNTTDPSDGTQSVTCYQDATTGSGALPSAFTLSNSQGTGSGVPHIWLKT